MTDQKYYTDDEFLTFERYEDVLEENPAYLVYYGYLRDCPDVFDFLLEEFPHDAGIRYSIASVLAGAPSRNRLLLRHTYTCHLGPKDATRYLKEAIALDPTLAEKAAHDKLLSKVMKRIASSKRNPTDSHRRKKKMP